ncbi:hypothetical protein U6A24_15040 [Aquimarina gracilis]|uniref:Uncharacterized protein n=1 Tax=Aquimarina gracilis TaxID=874422 RepID=A0ABU5ZY83_9FLAO|nr:hypothetical protein [Aquimarina gracilis]MEB3346792.1 hypothetical protein [Aquimarina gracilis]
MNIRLFSLLILAMLILSCQKEEKQDPFEISNNRIGLLTNEITVKQLDSIFATDSIVKRIARGQSLRNVNEIEIFEKGGSKLLVLEARQKSAPSATIQNIQIIDPRYKTGLGVSSSSNFKDIKDNYSISKINNTLSTAVIFVDSIQAYFTIDKKELPQKFQFNTDTKIEISDIPDTAKIKHFWIHWDEQ